LQLILAPVFFQPTSLKRPSRINFRNSATFKDIKEYEELSDYGLNDEENDAEEQCATDKDKVMPYFASLFIPSVSLRSVSGALQSSSVSNRRTSQSSDAFSHVSIDASQVSNASIPSTLEINTREKR